MKKRLQNQQGVVSALLIVLVIALIAVGGFAVYRAHNKVVGSNTSTNSTTTTASPSLAIKEMGVKIPLKNGPSDLTYAFSHNSELNTDVAQLGTKSTLQACGTGHLGSIHKVMGIIPSTVQAYYTTDANGQRLDYLLKQFNGFYLQHIPSQNPCTLPDGKAWPDAATVQAVIKSVQQADSIK